MVQASEEEISAARQARTLYQMTGVFGVKPNHASGTTKLKARLVVRGDQQRHIPDYETSSGTASAEMFRATLAMSGRHQHSLGTVDVTGALLNATVLSTETEVVALPNILLLFGLISPQERYMRVVRSVYGRKQSPRDWSITRDSHLRSMRWSHNGESYFLRSAVGTLWQIWCSSEVGEQLRGWILVYVDDLLISTPFTDQGRCGRSQAKMDLQRRRIPFSFVSINLLRYGD